MGMFDGGPESTIARIQLSPADRARLENLGNQIMSAGADANAAFRNAAGQVQTDFRALAPEPFRPSPDLDATSQRLVSGGLASLARQGAAADRSIARSVSNPGLSRVLQFQQRFNTTAAGNPLRFQAHQAQGAREAQDFQLRLAESQQNANLMQLGNNALGFQTQLLSQPFQTTLQQLAASGALGTLLGERQNLTMGDYRRMEAGPRERGSLRRR